MKQSSIGAIILLTSAVFITGCSKDTTTTPENQKLTQERQSKINERKQRDEAGQTTDTRANKPD